MNQALPSSPAIDPRSSLLLQQLETLPTLPTVAIRVLELTGREDTQASQITQLIESDPALTSRVLHMMHSAHAGVRDKVTGVDRAVILLGFEAVRNAVLAVGVIDVFASHTTATSKFDRDGFWKHCLAVACCAQHLAELRGLADVSPGEAFIAGMLHDLGKLALDAALPKSFGRVVEASELLRGDIADLERQVIGLDHMVVGKRLAERWMLPTALVECIWLHGQHPDALPATVKSQPLVNLVTLADVIVREQHIGYSGNFSFNLPRASLLEATGLTDADLEAARSELVKRLEPRAEAIGLNQATSDELYRQAITSANKQLGRLGDALTSRNRKLSVKAKFFESLARFHGEIRADSPPGLVLQAIAQTAVEAIDVTQVCAFSLPPDQSLAETIVLRRDGVVVDRTIAQPPTGAELPAKRPMQLSIALGDGPIYPAGQEIEWLTQQVAPRLGGEQIYWIALLAEGGCIGGILWGGPAGEAQRLAPTFTELSALAGGWALALRTSQIREESRTLAEQLAEANRKLQTAQQHAVRARMLASVSELAAGAAHEINNPLMVISGRSQLLARSLSNVKDRQAAQLIFEQSQRASDIITDLMSVAQPTPPTITPVQIASVLQNGISLAKRMAEPGDRIIDLTVGVVPSVLIDAEQTTQAVAELIANAFQATDARTGHIRLSVAFDTFSRQVVATITDNGIGMDDSVLSRAFEPFFSAKTAGRRRGMGLAKALRWIECSGGMLRLESTPAKGTRAMVYLPT